MTPSRKNSERPSITITVDGYGIKPRNQVWNLGLRVHENFKTGAAIAELETISNQIIHVIRRVTNRGRGHKGGRSTSAAGSSLCKIPSNILSPTPQSAQKKYQPTRCNNAKSYQTDPGHPRPFQKRKPPGHGQGQHRQRNNTGRSF